jgi:hypothetical protein
MVAAVALEAAALLSVPPASSSETTAEIVTAFLGLPGIVLLCANDTTMPGGAARVAFGRICPE